MRKVAEYSVAAVVALLVLTSLHDVVTLAAHNLATAGAALGGVQ